MTVAIQRMSLFCRLASGSDSTIVEVIVPLEDQRVIIGGNTVISDMCVPIRGSVGYLGLYGTLVQVYATH